MAYYLIRHDEDGGYDISQFDNGYEMLAYIKENQKGVIPEYRWHFAADLRSFERGSIANSTFILEGNVVIPKAIKVVEEYVI